MRRTGDSKVRFAAISDIHGNLLALKAVLADIARENISEVVNLGDHFSGPLQANLTAEFLISQNFPSIRGNHDRYLIETPRAEMGLSDTAAFDELSPAHLDWLKALPSILVFRDEVLLCHGTPNSDSTYWMEQVSADGAVGLKPVAAIAAEALGFNYPVILCGHTHIPRLVRLVDGRLIVNTGSVGLPAYQHDDPVNHLMQTGNVHASYAIVEKRDDVWNVSLKSVPYDHMSMSKMAQTNGRADWASALATGWIA
jgi:predicted phosphodiesterase